LRGIKHAIYWKLHASFLKNDQKRATSFLSMLEDEVKHGPRGMSLEQEIGAPHYLRYLRIRDKMRAGEYGRLHGQGPTAPDLPDGPRAERSGPESEFCRQLLNHRGLFMSVVDMEGGSMMPEVEMGEYGRCDFVVRAGRRLMVSEVKMGDAPTSVVAQIDKYRLCAELDMNLGLHDEVLAVVMAERFPPCVASELSRMSVLMVEHHGDPGALRIIG